MAVWDENYPGKNIYPNTGLPQWVQGVLQPSGGVQAGTSAGTLGTGTPTTGVTQKTPGALGTWGPMILSSGLGILGGALNARAANQPEKWRQDIINRELQRRNMLQGMAAPALLGALGYNNAGNVRNMQSQIAGTPQAQMGAQGSYSAGGAQPSRFSQVLGLGGSGVGTAASVFPKSFVGGPVGLGIGAGLLGAGAIAGKVGEGRRTANTFVQGTEDPFGADLAKVSVLAKTDPVAAARMLQEKYGNYQAVVQAAMAAGGTQGKVAQQSLNNPKLRQTIEALKRETGAQF